MKKLIILLLTIVSSSIFCQKKNIIREFSLPEKTPLFASYYGNLGIHPGVKIGFEYSLFLKEKTKEKKRKIKKIRKNLILAPSVAFYSHRNSHSGLLVSGDLLWRRYTKRLFISELGVGLGLYTKFNSGTTYEVTTNGIEEKGMTARSYFTPTLSYSFGKRFNFNNRLFACYNLTLNLSSPMRRSGFSRKGFGLAYTPTINRSFPTISFPSYRCHSVISSVDFRE